MRRLMNKTIPARFMPYLLTVAFLVGFLVASASGQDVRIHLPDGSWTDGTNAGTSKWMHVQYKGSYTTIANIAPYVPDGEPVYHRGIQARGPGLVHDESHQPDSHGWVWIVPPDETRPCTWWPLTLDKKVPTTQAPNRIPGLHVIAPGEVIPVFWDRKLFDPPPKWWADFVQREFLRSIDTDFLTNPRFRSLLATYGNEFGRWTTPAGDVTGDMFEVQTRWGDFFGGANPSGWFTPMRADDGLANWKYDGLLWLTAKYLLNGRRIEDWRYLMKSLIEVCAHGQVWTGPSRGMLRYEKSGDDRVHGVSIVGGNWKTSPAKNWVRGQITATALTSHPFAQEALRERMDWFRRTDPLTVWSGFWGARIGGVYLDGMFACYLRTGDRIYRAHAERAIRSWMTAPQLDEHRLVWLNRAAGGETTTPGFNAELAAAMGRWMDVGVCADLARVVPGDDRIKLEQVCASIWANGTDDVFIPRGQGPATWADIAAIPSNGLTPANLPVHQKTVRYRFYGSESYTAHASHVGYLVPMLRWWLGPNDPTYLAMRECLWAHIGGSWGYVPPLPLGQRNGRAGPGLYKTYAQVLLGAIR